MTATDDTIASLEEWQKLFAEIYNDPERQKEVAERIKTCDKIIASKESTTDRKLIALLQREILFMREQGWTGRLGDLSQGLMLACNIKMIELQVEVLSTVLTKSGILNKVKDIEEITKLKDKISRYEKLLKEKHKRDLEQEKELREHLEKLGKDFRYVC